jgi:hypothetical protein
LLKIVEAAALFQIALTFRRKREKILERTPKVLRLMRSDCAKEQLADLTEIVARTFDKA